MQDQVIIPTETGKSKVAKWLAMGIVSFLLLGVFLYFGQMELGIFTSNVVVTGAKTAGVKNVNTNAVKKLASLVPSSAKADFIEIKFIPHMPDTYDEMYAVSRSAKLGSGGVGAGCGKLKRSLLGLKTEFSIFLTGEKIVTQMGRDEASRQVNAITRMCLVWAQWAPTRKTEEFADLTEESYIFADKTWVIEI